MKAGKNIDSIFRDRFKEAKVQAPQDSWKNILSQLPQKREKRVLFPLWAKLGGVAAVLAVIFGIANFSSEPSNSPILADTSKEGNDFSRTAVSSEFNEIMQESSVLLQALILRSQEMSLQQQQQMKSNPAKQEFTNFHIASEISEVSENSQNSFPIKNSASKMTFLKGDPSEELSEEINSSAEVAEVFPEPEKVEPGVPASEIKESQGKFKLSTRVAPVYFKNFGKGNAVDNNFSSKAAGEVTFSYGLSVAYGVSDKLNIRSGINKVDLAYSTREVSYNQVAATFSSRENMKYSTTLASPSNGTLNQKMGFIEVPLELEYLFLEKKFALGLLGGGSVLLLDENAVSYDSFGSRSELGGNRNMNQLSFTTNLGLSIGYDISKQLQFNLEPVMKLQINTFKNSAASNPFFFGVYSGLSYRF